MDKNLRNLFLSISANHRIEKNKPITVQVLLCSPVVILIMTVLHTSQADSALILHLRSVLEKHAQKGIVRNYHLGFNTALYYRTNDVYIHFKEN